MIVTDATTKATILVDDGHTHLLHSRECHLRNEKICCGIFLRFMMQARLLQVHHASDLLLHH
jgi:hypothetical protein